MATTPETSLNNDVIAAVAGAASGDPTQIRALVDRARKHVEQRAVDELRRRLDGDTGAAVPGTGPAAGTARTAEAAAPRSAPRMTPLRSVRVRLSSGKQMRVALTPAPARASDLAALSRTTADNDRRAFRALHRRGKALDELAHAQADLADRVSELEDRGDFALVGLLRGFGDLERRMKTLATQLRSTDAAVKAQAQQAESQATSAQLQKVLSVVSSAQVAAFGEPGSVFSTNNLLLAGNQLLWGFIEPVLRAIGIDLGPSPGPLTYAAPVGAVVVGTTTAGRSQQVRFLSGVTTFPPGSVEQSVSLVSRIAPANRDGFARRPDVLVIARALNDLTLPDVSPPGGGGGIGLASHTAEALLDATVVNATLLLTLSDPLDHPVGVSWLVDTGLGGG